MPVIKVSICKVLISTVEGLMAMAVGFPTPQKGKVDGTEILQKLEFRSSEHQSLQQNSQEVPKVC